MYLSCDLKYMGKINQLLVHRYYGMTGIKKLGLAVWTIIALLGGFLLGYIRGFDDAYEFSTNPPRLTEREESHEE
jgi:hypothetical protein